MKGKGFTSPRNQGGWLGIAAAVVGGIASSYSNQSAANTKNKQDYASQSQLSTLNFEQQNWLAQQSHKWDLQDFQLQHNYNQGLIAGFDGASGTNKATPDGSWPTIKPVDVSAQTAGLSQTDANGNPLIYDPRTGKPMLANAQVPQQTSPIQPTPPAGTLTQFAGAG
jgi:hypothetical protein